MAGRHIGRDAALAVLAEATARTDRELVEVVDVLHGDRLGALVVIERLGSGTDRRECNVSSSTGSRTGSSGSAGLYDEDQAFVDVLWSRTG